MKLVYNPADDVPARPRKTPVWFTTPHPEGCDCSRCDLSPLRCPVVEGGERCTKVCRGRRALGSHVIFIHKRRKRKMAAILQPDGLGYLKKTFADPKRIYGLNLSALPRFSKSLTQSTILRDRNRLTKRSRAATRYLLERAQANLDGFVRLNEIKAPGKLIEPVAQLAKHADVPVWVVVDALLAYGLEKLAHELRMYRTAPDPHIPGGVPQTDADCSKVQQSAATLFPTG